MTTPTETGSGLSLVAWFTRMTKAKSGFSSDPAITGCACLGAEGLTYVIEQRNKLLGLLPEEDKLFGGEAAPADQPKKKRRQVHNNIEVEHVDIQLPEDFGTIVVRAADKVTSDLQVLLEEASLHKLFGWMKHKRLAFDDPSRVYRKTGKYAKNRQALQRDDDDGDDDEIPEQNPIQDYNLVTSDEDS